MKIGASLLLVISSFGVFAQQSDIVSFAGFQNHMAEKGDHIKVINFWATWCAPCIKELPLFEALTAKGDSNIKVTLVSMDLDLDPNPEKVYKFMKRRNIQSKVLLLKEPNPNSWIDKVDKSWSGALPATLIINSATGKRKFVEGELKEGQLEQLIAEVSS